MKSSPMRSHHHQISSSNNNNNNNQNDAMMNHLWTGMKGKLQELEQEHYQGRREVLAMRKAFGLE